MIVVFGSINIDLVTRAARIPGPGETVLGGDYVAIPGGKGANQALAARRAGARSRWSAPMASMALLKTRWSCYVATGVDLSASHRVEKPTGAAFIVVDDRGENAIVVASGANADARAAQLDGDRVREGRPRVAATRDAHSGGRGGRGLGAPSRRQGHAQRGAGGAASRELIGAIDYLCVNEHEVEIVGASLGISAPSPKRIAAEIERRHEVATIVTLGAAGAVGFYRGERHAAPAPQVAVVDTTGAGEGSSAPSPPRWSGLSFADAMRARPRRGQPRLCETGRADEHALCAGRSRNSRLA